MSSGFEHIHQLVLEEIAGSISQADLEHLNRVTASNAEAQAMRENMLTVLTNSQVQEELAVGNERLTFEALQERRKKRAKIVSLKRLGSVAAALLAGASITLYMFTRQPDNREFAAATPGSKSTKRIELKLPDGEVVDLSSQQGTVQAGNLVLNNTNKTLKYTAGSTGATWATLRVPAGKDYTVHLNDGTEIQLNAATTLQFPMSFTGDKREVIINGEAYLQVAKRTGKPFIVHLPGISIQVLGTSFNVNTYDSGHVRIALVDGSVKINTPEKATLLKPGYELSYSENKGTQLQPFDPDRVLSWRQGIYLFRSTPFVEVSKVVSRWYGKALVVDNPIISTRAFTGYIDRNEPISVFLDNLKATKGIDYQVDEDEVIHIK